MTELEKKLLLTKNEYDYLMEHFGYESPRPPKPRIKQINYYFDTDDLFMNRKNITCRIRLKDGKYRATMKQHSQNSDHSIETEMEIYNGITSNSFTNMGLKLQGKLETVRCIILKDEICEVALDKNEYLGHTDYELEIEYALDHEKEAQSIFRFFRDILTRRKYFLVYEESVTEAPSAPSKSSRFFQKKLSIKHTAQTGEKVIDENAYVPQKRSIRESNFASSYEVNMFDETPVH